jgi:LysM repeat protein
MLDRIAEIVLVVLGALLLVLLIAGLSVSCRGTAADPIPPSPTPFVDFVTPDPPATASSTPFINTTAIPGGTVDPGATIPPGGTLIPGTTPGAGETPGTGATVGPGATAVPGVSTAPPATTQPIPIQPGTTVQHVVSRGEWLLQIARCYGASYQAVWAANRLPNPDYILPGAVIVVPGAGSQGSITGPPCVVAHMVVAGDTWQSLAQRYATTTAILQRANPGALSIERSVWVPRAP